MTGEKALHKLGCSVSHACQPSVHSSSWVRWNGKGRAGWWASPFLDQVWTLAPQGVPLPRLGHTPWLLCEQPGLVPAASPSCKHLVSAADLGQPAALASCHPVTSVMKCHAQVCSGVMLWFRSQVHSRSQVQASVATYWQAFVGFFSPTFCCITPQARVGSVGRHGSARLIRAPKMLLLGVLMDGTQRSPSCETALLPIYRMQGVCKHHSNTRLPVC